MIFSHRALIRKIWSVNRPSKSLIKLKIAQFKSWRSKCPAPKMACQSRKSDRMMILRQMVPTWISRWCLRELFRIAKKAWWLKQLARYLLKSSRTTLFSNLMINKGRPVPLKTLNIVGETPKPAFSQITTINVRRSPIASWKLVNQSKPQAKTWVTTTVQNLINLIKHYCSTRRSLQAKSKWKAKFRSCAWPEQLKYKVAEMLKAYILNL